jgi:glutathionylspermidine synthase
MSNKAMLPLLWERHPGHPNLLPAYFDGDPRAAELGSAFVRKPFFSREGWDLELVDGDTREEGPKGGYGEEGHILQALAPLSHLDGNYRRARQLDRRRCRRRPLRARGPSRITRNVSRSCPT